MIEAWVSHLTEKLARERALQPLRETERARAKAARRPL
jgi:hypothetical protein